MANEARLNLVISAQDQARTVIEEMVNNIKSAFDGLGNLTVGTNFATDYEEQFRDMLLATEESTAEIRNAIDTLDNGFYELISNSEKMAESVSMGFETMARTITESTDQMIQSLSDVGQSSQSIDESLKFMNLQMAGEMIKNVGEEFTGFFEHAVSSAADFDQNIVNTTASLNANLGTTKLNTEQIKAMQDAAIKMGEAGFYSANEVSEAQNVMAKNGLTYQQIMNGGIDTVYKVAAANQASIEDTANVVSDIYNEMDGIFKESGMTAQQAAQQIGNSMTVAMHHAKISMDDFMTTMKYVGPQASAMGVDIKNVSSLISLLGQHAIRGSQAGTTLRTFLTNLTPVSKAAAEEMKKLGMITKDGSNIFFDASGKMKPMAEVQQILHDKIGSLNPQMQELAIKTIFGRYALSGMTAIVDTAPSKFQSLTAAMNNNNTMTDIMKEKSTGLGMEIQKLNSHWMTIQKTIGESLKPVVESLMSGLNSLMKSWEGLNPGVQKAIILFSAISGVLMVVGGGLLAFIGTVGMFATAFMEGLSALGSVLSIGLPIIAVLALIGVAAYELYTHWNTVKSGLISAWNAVSQTAISIWNGISNFFKQWGTTLLAIFVPVLGIPLLIAQHWGQIKTFANQIFTEAINLIKNIWNGAVNWIKGAAQAFANIIVDAFQWMYNHNYYFKDLVDFIRNAWKTAQNDAQAIWSAITSFLQSSWSKIVNAANSAFSALRNSLSSIWNAIVSAARSSFTALSSFLSNLWNSISSAVSNAWNAIASTMSSKTNQAISAVKGPFQSLGSFFSGLYGEAEQWGANLINMMANGIKSAAGAVGNAVKSVASNIASMLGFHSPTKEGPGSDADKWMPNMINMFTEGIQQHAPKLQMAISNVALGLKTGTTQMGNTINQNHISIPSNRTASASGTNIYINIDGRSAKTDNDLAEIIAHKIYRQMPVVS